jgi:hypothetical protein
MRERSVIGPTCSGSSTGTGMGVGRSELGSWNQALLAARATHVPAGRRILRLQEIASCAPWAGNYHSRPMPASIPGFLTYRL